MSKVTALRGAFPLHENREFLREHEWVILKLLCRPVDSLADADAGELAEATGGQMSVERCDELIRTIRISRLNGLGTWISRLFAEAGFSDGDIRNAPAETITGQVNSRSGYPLCNEATTRALASLQLQWRGAGSALPHA